MPYRCLLLLVLVVTVVPPSPAQNSHRRVRPQPSATAARAGLSVSWRTDLDTALADARRERRPVFWYVPTIAGSPMDRRSEVHRAIMAGPFSWPRTIELLNGHYIPLRLRADADLCQRFGLQPVEFIEPGYLVLDGEGRELARMDRMTTFHPAWFLAPLAARVGQKVAVAARFPGGLGPADAATFFEQPDSEAAVARLTELSGSLAVEARYLRGAGWYARGHDGRALEIWRAIAEAQPDHPLAQKAAMEVVGYGPFVRGLETFAALPRLQGAERGTQAAAGTYTQAELWHRGVAFLDRMQRGSGAFVDSIYDFGGTDSLPNVYTAVTAIVVAALLEAPQVTATTPVSGALESRSEAVLERAMQFLLSDDGLNREDTDELVWAYLYRIRALCRWLDVKGEDPAVRTRIEQDVAALISLQRNSGAFAHQYASPFVTAQALVALAVARDHGVTAPDQGPVAKKALELLERCRTEQGAYTYYVARRQARASLAEGVGRMPLGEHARLLWDRGSLDELRTALQRSFEFEQELFLVRKYDDHASHLGYGGFFFWYDLHVRTEAILALPNGRERTRLMARQREQILQLPELDGAFVDSHELGRSYGTAMALWCLGLLEGGAE